MIILSNTYSWLLAHAKTRMIIPIICVSIFTLLWCTNNPSVNKIDNRNILIEKKPIDSLKKIVCSSFIDSLYNNKNLVHLKQVYAKNTISEKGQSKYFLISKFKEGSHLIKYEIESNKTFNKPFLYDFEDEDYVSSSIIIDKDRFQIDSFTIEPDDGINKKRMNIPLTFCDLLFADNFIKNGTEYVLLHGYPRCNGRSCRESYLFLFTITKYKKKLMIINYNEYHPFNNDNIFIGDWRSDNSLYCFIIDEIKQDLIYNINLYKIGPEALAVQYTNEQNCILTYSCELCSGELNDTIILTKQCK